MKIFCIGLPKTGTTSLTEAFEILGLKSKHYINPVYTQRYMMGNTEEFFSEIDKYDFISDVPIPYIFPVLDKKYPSSIFIHTTRDKNSWLKSCERHYNRVFGSDSNIHSQMFDKLPVLQICGSYCFNLELFSIAYDRHIVFVKEYFKNHQNRLLEMNIINGDGWKNICDYFCIPIPKISFPHREKS